MPIIGRALLRALRRATLACIAVQAAAGCDHDTSRRSAADAGAAENGETSAQYRAKVRWTSYGVPHFIADDLPSVAYASAYVTSKDSVCILADQFVRLRSERSKHFGPGDLNANLTSDFGILAAGVHATALHTFGLLDAESRDLIVAYAAGYNRYLDETPSDELPEPCRGAPWVKSIEPEDLWTYYYYLSMDPDIDAVFDSMGNAQPEALNGAHTSASKRSGHVGSNGWAIGKDRSENGHGMLLANPHLPWQGPRRLYEQHITVPGVMNVYGAGWLGMPVVAIGFNEAVAWTHTASAANHATYYKLDLVPGNPTHYMFDGEEREMSSQDYVVDVKQPDGSFSTVHRTLYRSHYGPLLGAFGTPWSDTHAYTYRDANDGNKDFVRTYLSINRARALADLEAAQAEAHGLSWLNIVAVSRDGTALFFNATRTPVLNDAAEQAFRSALTSDYETGLAANESLTLLPGNSSQFDWQDRDALIPGIFAQRDAPRLERSDFVTNSNDSHWLTNPAAPLTGFSALFGREGDDGPLVLPSVLLSARTRMNLKLLTETGATSAAGPDGKFSLEELAAVPYNDRALMGELLRDAVVERCRAKPMLDAHDPPLDLTPTCSVLADWDLRVDADSVGALLWREFLGDFFNIALGAIGVFQDAFDPNDPIGSPHTLVQATSGNDGVTSALGRALDRLQSVGADASATLRNWQFAQRGDERMPIQGGLNTEGAFSVVEYQAKDGTLLPGATRGTVLDGIGLTAEGYPVNAGSSFMLAATFTDAGPKARAVLTYAQSADPKSPHYNDQMQLFSTKTWRDVRFSENDIAADPELHEQTIAGARH